MLATAVFTRIPAKVRFRWLGLRKDVSIASGFARPVVSPSPTVPEVTDVSSGKSAPPPEAAAALGRAGSCSVMRPSVLTTSRREHGRGLVADAACRDFSGRGPNMSGMKVAREARSAAVVINAGSRRGGAAHERAVDLLYKAGVPITSVHHVLSGAELAGTLDRVVADGHDLIVVGGGDGTVSCAAGRVAGTDVTLGIL